MPEGLSLKDWGELSKPATVLIEKIADATGGVFRPFQIRRVAQAEADAEMIKASAKIEIADLERRALHRFLHEEAKNQANIESITQKALPAIEEKAQPEKIENDWITSFFDECRLVSDEQMQNLWSKVLAGEANKPGKFPRRIFRILKDLEPGEAKFIDKIASKILVVEDYRGNQIEFLNVDIYEEWILGKEREKKLLGTTLVENIDLLQELGLVDRVDYAFSFSVEGQLQPNKIHIAERSARRVFSAAGDITPEHIQPDFLRALGPTVVTGGRPMINQWIKCVTFDAWKITGVGKVVFGLSKNEKDLRHFKLVKEILLKSGIRLK